MKSTNLPDLCVPTGEPIPMDIEVDPSLWGAVSELSGLLQPLFKRTPKFAADILNGLLDGDVQFLGVKQLPTFRAGELWFSAHPSGRLLELVATLRAGEIKDGFAV